MNRIGLVEDNPDNRLLIKAMIGSQFEIDEYIDGIVALEGLKENPPDLILLDISLPRMDGPEVLRHMREDGNLKRIPVIALTAHAMLGDRERFLKQGFDDYVTKPIVDENILVETIHRLIAGT